MALDWRALDAHITGAYGEDLYPSDDELFEYDDEEWYDEAFPINGPEAYDHDWQYSQGGEQ